MYNFMCDFLCQQPLPLGHTLLITNIVPSTTSMLGLGVNIISCFQLLQHWSLCENDWFCLQPHWPYVWHLTTATVTLCVNELSYHFLNGPLSQRPLWLSTFVTIAIYMNFLLYLQPLLSLSSVCEWMSYHLAKENGLFFSDFNLPKTGTYVRLELPI